jgi:hypothetical protein
MNTFVSQETGKFLGGIILYSFDNDDRTKVTASVEGPRENHAYKANMQYAVACEISENGEFTDVPVTLSQRHIDTFLALKADGEIRPGPYDELTVNQKNALQYLVDRILNQLGEHPTEAEKADAKAREIGTHVSHCCERHGCKYGEGEYCAVESKTHKQDYPCEFCVDIADAEAQIEHLKEEINFVQSLKKG